MTVSVVEQAVAILNNDGVIITVTDTIPGLSCAADSEAAIKKILSIKQRPSDKGLILTAGQLPLLEAYCQPLTAPQRIRVTTTETPTTWLVNVRASVSPLLTGQYDTIAIRLSSHPIITELSQALKQPLVTTSANLHSQSSAMRLDEIPEQVVSQVDLVLDGETGTGAASTIKTLDTDQIIRS